MSNSEVLTLAILAQWPCFRSERDFWRFAWVHLRSQFPSLCSQSQFSRRIRALEPEMRALQRAFAGELAEPSAGFRVMYDARPCDGEGEAFWQAPLLRAGELRKERVQGQVGL